MTETANDKERAAVAAALEEARAQARAGGQPERVRLPEPHGTKTAAPLAPVADAAPPPLPPAPSGEAVNTLWEARPTTTPRGLRGALGRLLHRLLSPWQDAQVAFNSHQVQLDNALLEHVTGRFHETHRHYDAVLGAHGQRLNDVDERHLILQEELVAHVHDLVRRIDLVLSEAERGRLGLEADLRALDERVRALERRRG
ncbi:MAG TPA: hypothetical protein VII13_10630 [Vicinamibacteria bacterium]